MKKTDEENQERNHPGYKVIPDKDRSGRFSYNPKSFASGANATVHLGYDGQTGRVCAVKIALPPDQNTILSQESNLKEAQVLAELNEPSVIDIYAHIQDGNKEYTVMAYMDPEVQPNLANVEELKTHMRRDGLVDTLTVSLAPIFSKALSQDPEQRYASPTEFVNALASALSPEPSRTRA